ncbi:hypothetical protein Tco_1090242 [Tanacetum coccineum]|uniref:Uncharacterized protein n=1 Tax=Tanacetum coccineum TaxID=301880 RepID=A0ABQ5I4X1_9ASTR
MKAKSPSAVGHGPVEHLFEVSLNKGCKDLYGSNQIQSLESIKNLKDWIKPVICFMKSLQQIGNSWKVNFQKIHNLKLLRSLP